MSWLDSYRVRSNPGTTTEVHRLYREAIAADEAFSKALHRAYGRRAGDMRYAYKHPGHPEVEAASEMFRTATEAYQAKTRTRSNPVRSGYWKNWEEANAMWDRLALESVTRKTRGVAALPKNAIIELLSMNDPNGDYSEMSKADAQVLFLARLIEDDRGIEYAEDRARTLLRRA